MAAAKITATAILPLTDFRGGEEETCNEAGMAPGASSMDRIFPQAIILAQSG